MKRLADSDDDVPIFAQRMKRLDDSDDDSPVFGDKICKIRQQGATPEDYLPQEVTGLSQEATPEDYLAQEVTGLSQEELNAEAVDEAEARLGIAESMASTPSKNEFDVSRYVRDEEDIARTAAAKLTRFGGKDTLKISK